MSNFPTSPVPSKITPKSTHQTYVSTSRSLRRQASSRGGHLWAFDLEYGNKLERDDFQPFWAFVVSQRGQYGTFKFVPAVFGNGQGNIGTSVPLVKGASQSGRSVITDGWQVGATMKAGDFFRFNGHTKVYMLKADIVADEAGEATLSIEPALYQSPADNEFLIVENVDFTCAFTDDSHDMDITPPILGTISLSITEVVEG